MKETKEKLRSHNDFNPLELLGFHFQSSQGIIDIFENELGRPRRNKKTAHRQNYCKKIQETEKQQTKKTMAQETRRQQKKNARRKSRIPITSRQMIMFR